MNKFSSLILSALFLIQQKSEAQNISGIINNYAAVTNISGTGISVSSATAFSAGDKILLVQMKGASIDTSNTSGFGNIISVGGAGTYEFLNVLSSTSTLITTASALTHTYNVDSGFVQVVRVPRYCMPVVTASLSCAPWDVSTGMGGIIAFEAGTLTLNAPIDANGKGFAGGNYGTGAFACDNGNFFGVQGDDGGQKGESISAYVNFHDGFKGKQANGGGGSNSGNSGGGGGANGGAGGLGGDQYSGCGTYDDRGIGGLSLTGGLSALFMGGGGGGGYQDNAQTASNGGNGGGIIYIRANTIVSNNALISANGEGVTVISDAEGAGGGGAGGTIFIECNNITGNLSVKTEGGSGGSNNNTIFVTDCHGTGGGGGGGVFAFSPSVIPPGITYSSPGGAAGLVNNSASSCFGTTHGAAAGSSGITLSGLPATFQMNIPVLTLTPGSATICNGESLSITAGGATNYTWSTPSSTNTTIVVSPVVTSTYSVSGVAGGTNSCAGSISATVTVSECTSINVIDANGEVLKMYPNPASTKLVFETARPVEILISDEMGRTVREFSFQKGEHTVDLSELAAGVYLVKALDGSGMKVGKLLKVD